MNPLRFTLLADGSSDRSLVRIIEHVVAGIPVAAKAGFITQFADPREVGSPGDQLTGRIRQAIRLFPCDILFVHRDAEREPRERRVAEVNDCASAAGVAYVIPIVPVRMTEAWLLLEETAIRRAADNPNGTMPLNLPRLASLESLPDPKKTLFELLTLASEKTGRRLSQFKHGLPWRRGRVAAFIDDFAPLDR